MVLIFSYILGKYLLGSTRGLFAEPKNFKHRVSALSAANDVAKRRLESTVGD